MEHSRLIDLILFLSIAVFARLAHDLVAPERLESKDKKADFVRKSMLVVFVVLALAASIVLAVRAALQ